MTVKIGKRIKALRKRDDVTQDKLAEVLGVTSQAISKWENETGYPDIEYITPIANFFNVTIDELFGHDSAEKERKIKQYCDRYDEMYRNWESEDDRVAIMRQALAEYPGEEKLLVRLATALWYKWLDGLESCYVVIDGKYTYDAARCKAQKGWEESAQIMEELLSTSVDNAIRSECRDILIRLYGDIGEKERVYQLAEYCPDCKSQHLYAAFNGKYDEEARLHSQYLLQSGLFYLRVHLPKQTHDPVINAEALTKIIDLYRFVFRDENFGFFHANMEDLYLNLAENLVRQGKTEDALTALENAYIHATGFDAYLDKVRLDGEYAYTSAFTDALKDVAADIYATKAVPELLDQILLDKNAPYYRKLSGNPRFEKLIERIKNELN